MSITLRPLNLETDLPRTAEIYATNEIIPVTADSLRERFRDRDGFVFRRLVAVDEAGIVLGVSACCFDAARPSGERFLGVGVHPAHRRQGIGVQLYQEALAYARQQGASTIRTRLLDHEPENLRFAEKHGFVVRTHVFSSVLKFGELNDSRFDGQVESVEASGIRFFTLADVGDTPENRHIHYDFIHRHMVELADFDGSFETFEQWQEQVYSSAKFPLDMQIVAADGEQWIGVSGMSINYGSSTGVCQCLTAVDRAYRRRGIALALKLLGIRQARLRGATDNYTDNDSRNAPMLAINEKLGYRSLPGWYGLENAVGEPAVSMTLRPVNLFVP